MKKTLLLTSHISLLITAVLAILFYKERCLFIDPGVQLFEMINEEGFKIYAGRYSMVVNQALPLAGIRMGLPLPWLMMLYSLSFVLVYYACFLLSVYGFRNIAAGVTIAFSPLVLGQAFAHSISEGWLGLVYSATFFAALSSYSRQAGRGLFRRLLYFLILLLLAGLNYFIHPSTLFTMGFAWVFLLITDKETRRWPFFAIGLLMILPFLVKFFFPATAYEDSFFGGIRKAPELVSHFGSLPIMHFIKMNWMRLYGGLLALIFITLLGWASRRRYLTAGWLLAAFIGYLLIAAFAFYIPSAGFALESRLIPLGMIVLVPFGSLIAQWERSPLLTVLLVLLMGWSYIRIYSDTRLHHTARLHTYETLLEQTHDSDGRKFYTFYDPRQMEHSWGASSEVLMLSAMEGKENCRTIYFFKTGQAPDPVLLQPDCSFLWLPWWKQLQTDKLNPRYFQLDCGPCLPLPGPGIQ